jgi:hypothetical protein
MTRQQKIARVLHILSKWGGFNVTEVQTESSIVVGELGGLVALIEYLSLDCIDVSIYSGSGYSSDSLVDYTMMYSELTDDVLEEVLLITEEYNSEMELEALE